MLTQYPWHTEALQSVRQMRTDDRLPHAILLSGPAGIGFTEFAGVVSAMMLCQVAAAGEDPCGECHACNLVKAGNHPDTIVIEPEETGKQIRVEQIRDLIEFITLKSRFGKSKLAIIAPADNMNRSAANTLLKTLEEPPGDSLVLLLTHRPDILPVTIRSRCQRLTLNASRDDATRQWLAEQLERPGEADLYLGLANGAPFRAIELAGMDFLDQQTALLTDLEHLQDNRADPVTIVENWQALGAAEVLGSFLQIMADMVRVKHRITPLRYRGEPLQPGLQRLANRLDLKQLLSCYDLLLKNYTLATSQTTYNTQALLEDFGIYWQSLPAR